MKTLIMIFIAFLTGCTAQPIINDNNNSDSAIAVCGGSIATGVTAKIEAEYAKLQGSVDASFERYMKGILDANGISDANYKAYLVCVQEIDKRQRRDNAYNNCMGKCKLNNESCSRTTQTVFDGCIKLRMDGCLRDCRKRGFSRDECYGKLCSWTDLDKKAKAYYTGICERNEKHRNQVNMCVDEEKNCRSKCSADLGQANY